MKGRTSWSIVVITFNLYLIFVPPVGPELEIPGFCVVHIGALCHR